MTHWSFSESHVLKEMLSLSESSVTKAMVSRDHLFRPIIQRLHGHILTADGTAFTRSLSS
ncbi:hypothetical protein HMPREF1986_01067 [Oribacterium sp. oral taxon 078 str. F0263]|nr:hypothetical protein HMPREF1986_01067 [Oribacterium sp. oral taxon 078 str. F0263]